MENKRENNYAFIDSQNVHMGIRSLGWEMDWKKFRVHLKDTYNVSVAYMFLGFISDNQKLYEHLQRCGFVLIFKPLIYADGGAVKGNCDADMVLHATTKIDDYHRAVIITSDGDFYSLVRFLYEHKKLLVVLSPYIKTCSKLLKKEAKERIYYMDNLRQKIGRVQK